MKIIAEGGAESMFEDEGEGEKGKVKWKDSVARSLLYKDVRNGTVDGMTWQQVFATREDKYSAYDKDKFNSRLAGNQQGNLLASNGGLMQFAGSRNILS